MVLKFTETEHFSSSQLISVSLIFSVTFLLLLVLYNPHLTLFFPHSRSTVLYLGFPWKVRPLLLLLPALIPLLVLELRHCRVIPFNLHCRMWCWCFRPLCDPGPHHSLVVFNSHSLNRCRPVPWNSLQLIYVSLSLTPSIASLLQIWSSVIS